MDIPTRVGLGGTALFTLAGLGAPILTWWISGPIMVFCAGVATWGFWPITSEWMRRARHGISASARDMPIHEAISHVAKAIGEQVTRDVFPRSRQALRQAALDGEIKVRGNKSADLMGRGWSAVQTEIPSTYWETAEVGALATDPAADTDTHTFPHQFTDGRFGEQIFVYTKLRVDRAEILKRWPAPGIRN